MSPAQHALIQTAAIAVAVFTAVVAMTLLLATIHWQLRRLVGLRRRRRYVMVTRTSPLPKTVSAQIIGRPDSKADTRAAQLLWDHLNDVQKTELLKQGYFTVNHYNGMVARFWVGGTTQIASRQGGRFYKYCILVWAADLPLGDCLLTKKMAFESNPKKFKEIAHFIG